MTRLLVRIIVLALVSIAGIGGMLLSEGGWDWLHFFLAAFPLLLGGGAVLVRRIR